MSLQLAETANSLVQIRYDAVVSELDELSHLAAELRGEQQPPLLTPDLSPLCETVQQLAILLAIADSGHLVNSVRNIETYLPEDPGAALHHIRELRRRLVFHRWPLARPLYRRILHLAKVEELLETQPLEHIAAVLEDLQGCRQFQRLVPAAQQPAAVVCCIESGVLFSHDPEGFCREHLGSSLTAVP